MPRSVRSLPLIAACLAASSFLPVVARAQAPDSSRGSVRVRVAGGMDLGIGDTYLGGGNALGVIGLEWLHRRAPFSARLDFSYFRSRETERTFADSCVPDCFFRSRTDLFGLSLDGRYTFFATRSVLRPYLVSGFGMYLARTTTTTNYNYDCTALCVVDAGPTRIYRDPRLGLGLHSGFGLALPIRGAEVSLELRYRQLTSGYVYPNAVPILLGIRF